MASTTDVVQNYQSMFAYRYTTEDKEYQKYLQCSAKPPPIIEDWMNREPSAPSVSEILQNYENKFARRFTSEDEEYQKYVQRPADPPPLLEDWRNRSGDSETDGNSETGDPTTTTREATGLSSGTRKATALTISRTTMDSHPILNMAGRSVATDPISRSRDMAATSTPAGLGISV
ncbi:hypothetical protein E2320_013450 [Naja naja]|nr:hypothetical protein E2320_013450 [Naja naja]